MLLAPVATATVEFVTQYAGEARRWGQRMDHVLNATYSHCFCQNLVFS